MKDFSSIKGLINKEALQKSIDANTDGYGGRSALYSGDRVCRKDGSGRSMTTAMCVGAKSFNM